MGYGHFQIQKKLLDLSRLKPEGKWVCAMNDTHWGHTKVGVYFDLEEAKRETLTHYNKYFSN